MVILIELVRKFSFRSFTQYLKAVTNFIAKSISEQVSDVVDDDLRATAALSTERIGHADNLTGGFILPKSQVAKVMQEGSADSELALFLYGNDVSNPNPKDMSGWDDKIISRVGFPCVVKTNPINNFNGRALAGLYQGIEDGLKVADNAAFQRAALSSGLSVSQWIYPLSDTPKPVAVEDQTRIKITGRVTGEYVNCGNDSTLWSQALTKFSFSCWFWMRGPYTALTNALFVDHSSNNAGSFTAWLNGTDPKRLNWRINKQDGSGAVDANCITERSMIGRWVHVVCTYDNSLGSANLKIYVDGIQGATTANYTGTINISAILTLGGPVNDFDGYVKDFRWWTTQALTQAQVDALFSGDEDNAPTPNYWLPMDEGVGDPIDKITGTKTGVLTPNPNGPTWNLFQPSKNYIWLDKVDDKFTILNHAAINNFTDFSVSFWFKPDDAGTSSTPNILSKNYANANSFILYHTFGTNALNYRVVNNAAVGTTVQAFVLTYGAWQHITATCEGATGLMKLYRNGVLVGSAYAGACVSIGTVADMIWSANVSVKSEFGFKDFRIFRRVLGPDEVEAIYEGLGDWIAPDQWFKVNEGELAPVSSVDSNNIITRTTGGTWKNDSSPDVQKIPVTIYAKRDDSQNHLVAFLDPIDRSVNIQLKKAGTYINKKTVGDNNVLWLDGINDRIDLGNQSDLWGSATKTQFSVSFWVNPYRIANSLYTYFFNSGWGQNYGIICYLQNTVNQLVFEIAAVWPARTCTLIAPAPSFAATGAWHFVTCTYDKNLGSNNAKLYIDGVLVAQGITTANTLAGSYTAQMSVASGDGEKGYLNDLRYWNRPLTQTEITAIYQGVDDLTMLPDYHLPMDEGSGTTLTDAISGTKTATLVNGPAWRKMPNPYVIDLDGVNDYVDCGNDATLWSQGLTKFSFSLWIYPDTIPAGTFPHIVNHGWAIAHSFTLYVDSTSGDVINISIKNAALTSIAASLTNIVKLKQWNHVVVVYDSTLGSQNVKLYCNNTASSNGGSLTETLNCSAALTLAAATTDFDGRVKDFRWWTTKALTAAEVTKLFNGTETYDMYPNFWLPMEEGTGNPVDIITGTKVGTITNGAAWVDTTIDSSLANLPTILYSKSKLASYYYYAYDLNKWNFIVIVYNPTGDVFTVFRDGRTYNVANSAATIKGLEPKTNDMHLGYSGPQIPDLDAEYYYYAFRMFKFWKKQLTGIDVGWENLNKMSISHLVRSEIPLAGFSTVSP